MFSTIRAGTISGSLFPFATVNIIIDPILSLSRSLSQQDVFRKKTAGSWSDPESLIKIYHFLCIMCVRFSEFVFTSSLFKFIEMRIMS